MRSSGVAARPPCDHHWVHTGAGKSFPFWIVQCSICHRFNKADMAAQSAAHDEQVRADERRRIATAIEARRGVGYVSTSTCEFADGARAALTAAAEIARTGSGEAT